MKCPHCDEAIPLSAEQIKLLSDEDLGSAVADLKKTIVSIEEQIAAARVRRDPDFAWRGRARSALRHVREDYRLAKDELSARQRSTRLAAHENRMADAQKAASDKAQARDRMYAERLDRRSVLFTQAARKLLSKEQLREIWEEAERTTPGDLVWQHM